MTMQKLWGIVPRGFAYLLMALAGLAGNYLVVGVFLASCVAGEILARSNLSLAFRRGFEREFVTGRLALTESLILVSIIIIVSGAGVGEYNLGGDELLTVVGVITMVTGLVALIITVGLSTTTTWLNR